MAVIVVSATFTGAEDSISVSWSGVGAQHMVLPSAVPSDGFGPIRPWLTTHYATQAVINVSARWQGKVTLIIFDTTQGKVWPTAPSAFRASWPIPYSTEVNGGTPTVYTRAQFFVSDVASVTTKIANAWSSGGVGSSLTSNVALYTSDGTGLPSGSALSPSPWLAQTVPGDGTFLSLGPTTITPRASDGKIVHLMSLAAAATVACSVTPLVHGSYSVSTATVSPPPAPTAGDPTPIAWVEFDYVTNRRKLVFIGDSIPSGVNTTNGFEGSFPYQVGVAKDYAIQHLTLPGSSLAQWAAFGTTSAAWWARGIFNAGVGVWIQAMVNDMPGATLVGLQTAMTTVFNHLKNDLGVSQIYCNTCTPDNSVNEAVRVPWNAWLIANSLGFAGVGDFGAKQNVGGLADNSNPANFFASFDSGDHLHPSDAGQNQMATIVQATVG